MFTLLTKIKNNSALASTTQTFYSVACCVSATPMCYSQVACTTSKLVQLNLYQHHSKELKFRLLYIVCTWIVAFAAAFYNMEFLLYKLLQLVSSTHTAESVSSTLKTNSLVELNEAVANKAVFSETLLKNPITENTTTYADFIFTEIFEAFFSYLVVSGYVAFILSLPILYYHIYHFLLPGLSFTESALLKILFFISTLFMVIAHLLTYFVILPYATSFLLTFQSLGVDHNSLVASQGETISLADDRLLPKLTPSLTFLGRVYPWVTFTINLFTAVSTLFHLPLLLFILFLAFKGLTSTKSITKLNLRFTNGQYTKLQLSKKELPFSETTTGSQLFSCQHNSLNMSFFRKLLFFTLVVLTAIFSPPDLYSQIFLLVPLFFIIELFLFAVFLYTEYINRALNTNTNTNTLTDVK